jgi:hypothetical protein
VHLADVGEGVEPLGECLTCPVTVNDLVIQIQLIIRDLAVNVDGIVVRICRLLDSDNRCREVEKLLIVGQ